MTKIRDLYKAWMKDPAYRKEYDALEEEFSIIAAIAKARPRAGLSQAELARRLKDDAKHRDAAGERTRPALHPHAATVRKGDRTPAQDQLQPVKADG